MRHILVTNAKGGCGKSTIATNLAAYYASEGYETTLADYDPQASALSWLDERPEDKAPITGLAAFDDGLRHMPRSTEYLIIDAPARSHGPELTALVNHAETIIVPVLPSPIDMKAGAEFIAELLKKGKIANKKARVAAIASRVKENTLIFEELDAYLEHLKVPYIAILREAQNYIRAYQRGLGIHELPPYLAWPDWEQWDPLIGWLNSRRSRPR
ncbi:MAG: ParA family protein [Pseudomonadota bacterium]|jgi:chromosome partitioning protein|nr:ParA family protein [Pseudomonadota bacterium]